MSNTYDNEYTHVDQGRANRAMEGVLSAGFWDDPSTSQ